MKNLFRSFTHVIIVIAIVPWVCLACSATQSESSDASPSQIYVGGSTSETPDPIRLDDPKSSIETGSAASTTWESFCNGSGIVVPTLNGRGEIVQTCTGQISSQIFRYALCTCDSTEIIGIINTDGWHFSQGPLAGGQFNSGGSVGVNNDLALPATSNIGGSLIVGGDIGLNVLGILTVGGDTKVHGDVSSIASVNISRDLWAEGDINSVILNVLGDTVQPPESMMMKIVGVQTATRQEDFTVPPPCACGDDQVLDVNTIVKDARQHNDNIKANFDPRLLANRLGVATVELPCGRLYAPEVSGVGVLRLVVNERTALFVDGDLNVAAGFDVDLGPQGELDVFIGGTLNFLGPARLGNPARPSGVRIYLGSQGSINMIGALDVGANIYAPHADVNLAAGMQVFGSIFAKSVNALGAFSLHYDSDILTTGENCDDTPSDGCDECDDCPATQGCIDGTCGPCRDDFDCCEPLICIDGVCTSDIII